MGRLHTHRHGQSHAIRPITPSSATWIRQSPKEIEELIVKYAKEGLTSSQIGMKLRDQYAIPLVKPITDKKVSQILEENGFTKDIPEDLEDLVKKAVRLQKHLREHTGDHRNVRSLELLEAKVHRVASYYKKKGRIPKTWKYKSVVAQLE